MKTILRNASYILTMFLCLLYSTSCSHDVPLNSDNKETTVITPINEVENVASLHSMTLDCVSEVIKEQGLIGKDLTSAQLYAVTESAVLKGVQKYISQKEGRTLTSTEESTLKKEVQNYWNDSRNRTLFKKISQGDGISSTIPTTGTPDLNQLYRNMNISSEAQKYFNKMFSNMNSSNYENILDQLYMEVWSKGNLSETEKKGVMNVIVVTKDSYKYWNNQPMTRISSEAKGVIMSDAAGAIRGLWIGIGRSAGSLIFGPGGAVLTLTGSVIVQAAAASVEAGVIAGLIRIFW